MPADRETMKRSSLVEVCVASLEDARAAESAGADRLELNAALELGGLTPSLGLVRAVVSAVRIPVIAMVRPRPGGFHYSRAEQQLMLDEISLLTRESIAGVAIGGLDQAGLIDAEFLSRVRDAVGARELVLHRAVDTVRDLPQAVQSAIQIGITRILSSGGAAVAADGVQSLAEMHTIAAGLVEILPASGINSNNAVQILHESGCDQIHGSFSIQEVDEAGRVVDGRFQRTDPNQVLAVINAITASGL